MSQQQIPLALHAPRRPAFDNFVVGPNAAVAHTLAHGLESGGWYFLTGSAGSGRSHLLAASFAALHERGIATSFLGLSTPQHRPLLETATGDWVLIDDIDALAGDAVGEMLLFNALNRWRAEQAGLIMSAAGREAFELPDLRSRLGQATRLRLHPLSEDDLASLIRQLAQEHEVVLGRGATDYLISRCTRNAGAVARLIETLALRAHSEHRTLSIPLIREALEGAQL